MQEKNFRRMERWHEIRRNDRYYSLTEGKAEYQYTKGIAALYAEWCKARKAEGKNLLFRVFFDSLPYHEQGEIAIRPWDGKSVTFRY